MKWIEVVQIGWVVLLGVFSGCTHLELSQSECLEGRWEDIGYSDALEGQISEKIQDHRSTCAEHGVSADAGRYAKGWQRGIKQFCTEASGRAIGERGGDYFNHCPKSLEAGFLKGFAEGLTSYASNFGMVYPANQAAFQPGYQPGYQMEQPPLLFQPIETRTPFVLQDRERYEIKPPQPVYQAYEPPSVPSDVSAPLGSHSYAKPYMSETYPSSPSIMETHPFMPPGFGAPGGLLPN